jgi:hypothetical protein
MTFPAALNPGPIIDLDGVIEDIGFDLLRKMQQEDVIPAARNQDHYLFRVPGRDLWRKFPLTAEGWRDGCLWAWAELHPA